MNSTAIEPFWNRLREIARYPFRDAALYTLITLTALIVLLGWFPVAGRFIVVVCWLGAYKYAFEILLTTANGKMKAPEIALGIDNSVIGRYFVVQFVTLALPALIALFVSFGIGITLFVVLVLVQPAAIMALAMTQSLRAALNPGLWLALMSRVGWPYLALFGLLLVMQLSALNASELLAAILPGFFAHSVALVFSFWSLFATFHLMGYMLWQYHEELGYQPKVLTENVGLPHNRDRELLDAAGACLQSGDAKAAFDLLRTEIRSRSVSVEAHELYRKLLQQRNDRDALLEHGRAFLHLLMMEKQERKALGLVRECLDLDPEFTALEFEQNAVLAERAAFGGQSKLAIDLLLALLKKEPLNPAAANWALRGAELMLRQSGRETEARTVLESAKANCQDTALVARIDALLAGLPA